MAGACLRVLPTGSIKDDDPILQLQIPESQITCQICMEIFVSPRILPCQHTFCKKCVTSLIQKHCLDLDGRTKCISFPCPNCRRECKIRQKGKYEVEEHLNKCFPENLLMKTIIDSKVDPACTSTARPNGEAEEPDGLGEIRFKNQATKEDNVFLVLSVFYQVGLILTCYKVILKYLINVISYADTRASFLSPLSFKRVNHNFLTEAVSDICIATVLPKTSFRQPLERVEEFVDEFNEITALQSDMLMIQRLNGETGVIRCDNFAMKDIGCQTSEPKKIQRLNVIRCDNFAMKDIGCQTPEPRKEFSVFSWIVLCVAVIISMSTKWLWHGS